MGIIMLQSSFSRLGRSWGGYHVSHAEFGFQEELGMQWYRLPEGQEQ